MPEPKSMLEGLFSFPLAPTVVLKYFSQWLTSCEKEEIIDYPYIWYLGHRAKKTAGPINNYSGLCYDEESDSNIMVAHDHIAFRYEVVKMLGSGTFGQVYECLDHQNKEMVAVKKLSNIEGYETDKSQEIRILQALQMKDQDNSCNIIHMKESFYFRKHLYVTFELLGPDLFEVKNQNNFEGFSMDRVKHFARELLKALLLLKEENIIHSDLKPENILMSHKHPDSIKVIDFGSSCYENEREPVYYIQTRFYRAPEVILGQDFSCAIDMWSLGCILAELFTGKPIFAGENEADQLACIMEVLGKPPSDYIKYSSRRKTFFNHKGLPRCLTNSKGEKRYPFSKSLENVLMTDDKLFVDFIKRCLVWDPEKRLTPHQAMQHEWIQQSFHKSKAGWMFLNRQREWYAVMENWAG